MNTKDKIEQEYEGLTSLETECVKSFYDFINPDGDGVPHKYITRTISAYLFASLGKESWNIDSEAIATAVVDQIAELFAIDKGLVMKVSEPVRKPQTIADQFCDFDCFQ